MPYIEHILNRRIKLLEFPIIFFAFFVRIASIAVLSLLIIGQLPLQMEKKRKSPRLKMEHFKEAFFTALGDMNA